MDNSAYVALSRQMTLFRDMDVTAGNIANANTTGYNAEHILFNSYLSKDNNSGSTSTLSMADTAGTFRDTSVGSLSSTGNSLDVAIEGPGYFMVQTPLGTRYTRAGNFQLAGDGTLITAEGYKVLDASSQPIELPEDTRAVKIGEVGNLQVNGQDFATIGVAQFSNQQLLTHLNGGLYSSTAAPTVDITGARMVQGALEGSNVQPVVELTHMMNLSHDVADNAKFIEIIYDLERKTASAWSQQSSS